VGRGGPGASDDDLQARIDALVRQVAANQSDIEALGRRVDDSNVRADASDARADKSDARADAMEARAEIDRDMIAALQRDGVLSREHEAQLEEALKSSRTIGAAVGIIMGTRQVSEDVAFDMLKAASNHSNRKLREIAAELVASANNR